MAKEGAKQMMSLQRDNRVKLRDTNIHSPELVAEPQPKARVEQEPRTEILQYRISGDSRVRLLFDGTVTKEAIEKLMAYLDLAKDDYPSKD